MYHIGSGLLAMVIKRLLQDIKNCMKFELATLAYARRHTIGSAPCTCINVFQMVKFAYFCAKYDGGWRRVILHNHVALH